MYYTTNLNSRFTFIIQGLFQNFAPGGANASGPNIRGGKY